MRSLGLPVEVQTATKVQPATVVRREHGFVGRDEQAVAHLPEQAVAHLLAVHRFDRAAEAHRHDAASPGDDGEGRATATLGT